MALFISFLLVYKISLFFTQTMQVRQGYILLSGPFEETNDRAK